MVAASKIQWAVLPYEVEQIIFLLASREPQELYTYILVAHRVKEWLEPVLYRKVDVYTEDTAQRVVRSLSLRQKTILTLYIDVAILPCTTAWLLRLCPRLVSLNLRAGGNSLGGRSNPVVEALNNLTCLKHLSVDPAALFGVHNAYLPDARAFNRITHLDMTTTWNRESIPRGLQHLSQLTHLSLTWRMSRASSHALNQVLARPTLQIVVFWRQDFEPRDRVIRSLLARGLDDPQIVVLTRGNYWTYEMHGSFWEYTAGILAWRKENNVTTMARPTTMEYINVILAPR